MAKKKPQTYNVKTIEDISKLITLDNADNFIKDFRGLISNLLLIKNIAEQKGFDANEIVMKSFIWIDDGKHKIETEFRPKKKRTI